MLKYERNLVLGRLGRVFLVCVVLAETGRILWRRRLLNDMKILKPKGGL